MSKSLKKRYNSEEAYVRGGSAWKQIKLHWQCYLMLLPLVFILADVRYSDRF